MKMIRMLVRNPEILDTIEKRRLISLSWIQRPAVVERLSEQPGIRPDCSVSCRYQNGRMRNKLNA